MTGLLHPTRYEILVEAVLVLVCAVLGPHIAPVAGMVDIARGALESTVDKVTDMLSTTMFATE
jgi:hypothetical protein